MKNKMIVAIGLGVVFFWSSLFLSYRNIPLEFDVDVCECANQNILAIGGFPFQTFEYGLAGNNWPTPEGWLLPFLGNLAFWIAIGFFVSPLFEKKTNERRWRGSLTILSFLISAFGVMYLIFLFD